jgi:hypothetical protein
VFTFKHILQKKRGYKHHAPFPDGFNQEGRYHGKRRTINRRPNTSFPWIHEQEGIVVRLDKYYPIKRTLKEILATQEYAIIGIHLQNLSYGFTLMIHSVRNTVIQI